MSERWHVLGVGAIGGLFACRLQSGGADVTLLVREDDRPTRELILKSDRVQRFQFPQQNLATDQQSVEHLLICTKAWAVEAAVLSIAPRLTAHSAVVLLCNGMGLAEIVAPLIGEAQLVLGSTTSGCWRPAENELILSGEGSTQLGTLTHSAEPPSWLPCWQQGVPNLTWGTDIRSVLLTKVSVNAVINPLTAIHQVCNGDLLQPPLWEKTQALITEVQLLLRSAHALDIAAALPERVRAVCESTSANHSSMRVDFERGARTEVDAIVGWLLRDLNPNPPETPLLSALFEAVRQQDRGLSSAS
jgi:2-dehydropantoate 2-reductase